MSKIRVVICLADPDRKPYVTNISTSITNLEKMVGGRIDQMPFYGIDEGEYLVICNRFNFNQPYNCDIKGVEFYGDIIVAAKDGEDFGEIPRGFLPEFLKHYYERR